MVGEAGDPKSRVYTPVFEQLSVVESIQEVQVVHSLVEEFEISEEEDGDEVVKAAAWLEKSGGGLNFGEPEGQGLKALSMVQYDSLASA